jgi:hypothetical protein
LGSVFSSSLVLTVLGCLQNSKRWRCLKFSVADVVSLELNLDNGHRLLLAPHHMRVRTRNGPSDRQFPQTQVGSPVASTSTLNTDLLAEKKNSATCPALHINLSAPSYTNRWMDVIFHLIITIRASPSESCIVKAARRRDAAGVNSPPESSRLHHHQPRSLARRYHPHDATRQRPWAAVAMLHVAHQYIQTDTAAGDWSNSNSKAPLFGERERERALSSPRKQEG